MVTATTTAMAAVAVTQHPEHDSNHNMSPSAASRVLNIPELLEYIFVHIPSSPSSSRSWGNSLPPPLFDLFVLKRVNSTFQTTINASKTCRQLMLLQSADGSRDSQVTLAGWLCSQLRLCTSRGLNRHRGPEADIFFVNGNELVVTGQLRDTVAYFAKIEEYRSVQWVRRPWGPEVVARDLSTEVELEQEFIGCREEDMQPSWDWQKSREEYEMYEENIGPSTGGDLGTLLDVLLAVLRRTPSQHRAARGKNLFCQALESWHPDFEEAAGTVMMYSKVSRVLLD